MYTLLWFVFAAMAAANPVDLGLRAAAAATTTTAFCSKVTSLVTSAKQQSAATAYCSSYLDIRTVTTTSTKTLTRQAHPFTTHISLLALLIDHSSGGVSTKTVSTVFVTVMPSTTTTTVTSISVPDACSATRVAMKAKRGGGTSSKPACFSSYTASALISSACSCLSIPTPTTTVAKSTTLPVLSTTSVTTTSTITLTATATATAFTQNFVSEKKPLCNELHTVSNLFTVPDRIWYVHFNPEASSRLTKK